MKGKDYLLLLLISFILAIGVFWVFRNGQPLFPDDLDTLYVLKEHILVTSFFTVIFFLAQLLIYAIGLFIGGLIELIKNENEN